MDNVNALGKDTSTDASAAMTALNSWSGCIMHGNVCAALTSLCGLEVCSGQSHCGSQHQALQASSSAHQSASATSWVQTRLSAVLNFHEKPAAAPLARTDPPPAAVVCGRRPPCSVSCMFQLRRGGADMPWVPANGSSPAT